VEAVYSSKGVEDCQVGTCVLDFERGIAEGIWPNPFQTDTCIGGWHYDRDAQYKTPKQCIDMLVNIVSRNGTLLLNFPLKSDGTLDPKEMTILSEITAWMAVNGEGIHGTRPWKICGEGPSVEGTVRDTSVYKRLPPIPDTSPGATRSTGARDSGGKPFTALDIRFTLKGKTLYAFIMGWPEREAVIRSLGTASKPEPGKIRNVELLGYKDKVRWAQEAAGLRVQMPAEKLSVYSIALKIALA
jgi:alpha-L-fucosidase